MSAQDFKEMLIKKMSADFKEHIIRHDLDEEIYTTHAEHEEQDGEHDSHCIDRDNAREINSGRY